MEWASNVCVTLSSNETLSAVGCQIRPIHSCQIEFACSLMLFRQHIMICRSINSWKSKCVTLNKCMALLSLPTTPYYCKRLTLNLSNASKSAWVKIWSKIGRVVELWWRRGAWHCCQTPRAPKLHHHPIPAASAPAPRGCASHESPTIKEEPVSNHVAKCIFISVSLTD